MSLSLVFALSPPPSLARSLSLSRRQAKIEDFNAVRDWVPMYDSIRYEDMLDVDNLKAWLQMLEST